MTLKCFGAQEMRFIYKDRVFKMTRQHIELILSLNFNKRDSLVEFAFIENFMVIRVSDTIYKLMDVPLRRQDRLYLLREEEVKTDKEINQI